MISPRVVTAAGGMRIALSGGRSGFGGVDLFLAEEPRHIELPGTPSYDSYTFSGFRWRRLWTRSAGLVFDFANVAVVEVRESDGAIIFDRRLATDMAEHVVLDHVLPLVLARRGQLVLHGAVISLGRRAAVLIGPSGSGKSTLTAFARAQGWAVGGDDGAVIRRSTPPGVEPTYPTIRLLPEAAALIGLSGEPARAVAGKWRLDELGEGPYLTGSTELALVVALVPAPQGAAAKLVPLRGADAHATLLADAIPVGGDIDAMMRLVDQLAHVCAEVAVRRLIVPRGVSGLRDAESVLRRELDTNGSSR